MSAPTSTSSSTEVVLPTLAPTPTHTPVPPGKVILVTSAEMDATPYQAVLAELASSSGWTVEVRQALQAGEVAPEWKVVVFTSPPANLGELARSAPQVQFVTVSTAPVEKLANLSEIRSRPELVAFTAGYVTIAISQDWRAGGLLTTDSPLGPGLEQVFRNGAGYLCGVCNSVNGPVTRFPVVAALPSGSSPTDWQAAADQLNQRVVNVMYVAPAAASPELLAYLVSKGMILVGGQAPPPEGQPRWAVTVSEDAAGRLRDLWPYLLNQQGGQAIAAKVTLEDIQVQFFSLGRQQLVQRMLQDLETGLILPFNPPLE